MKVSCLLLALAAFVLPPVAPVFAQALPEPSPPPDSAPASSSTAEALKRDLGALVERVQARLQEGQNSEAQLADELRAFDELAGKYATEKNDAAAAILVMKALLYVQVFDKPEGAIPIFRKIAADFPGTQSAEQVPAIIEELERSIAINATTAVGAEFPVFKETAIDGSVVDLAAYRGKVVLVDFWATWCAPCIEELPYLKDAYEKHHAGGFEIIGISLDQARGQLAGFVKQRKLPWPQLFDGMPGQGKLAQAYGIRVIPATFLLDRHGRIAAKNLRGEELSKKVAELLAEKT